MTKEKLTRNPKHYLQGIALSASLMLFFLKRCMSCYRQKCHIVMFVRWQYVITMKVITL